MWHFNLHTSVTVERAAQAAREAEASAAALLSASTADQEPSGGSEEQPSLLVSQEYQDAPNMKVGGQDQSHLQVEEHNDSDSTMSSSEDMELHNDDVYDTIAVSDPGVAVSTPTVAVTNSTIPIRVSNPITAVSNSDDAMSNPAAIAESNPTVVVPNTTAVYVDPPPTSLTTLAPLMVSCPDPLEGGTHTGRDPADLQAAQGLADLQSGQSKSLNNNQLNIDNNQPGSTAPNPMTMVNNLPMVSDRSLKKFERFSFIILMKFAPFYLCTSTSISSTVLYFKLCSLF